MVKGIWHSRQGIVPAMLKQEIISNNIANSQTPGFRKDRLFTSLLNTEYGKISSSVSTDFKSGPISNTDNPMDFAIDGENCFFTVMTPTGERFTRCGNFGVGPDGTLRTADGYKVLSQGGSILVNGEDFTVRKNGEIYINGLPAGKLKIVRIPDISKLVKEGSTLFKENGESSAGIFDADDSSYSVLQGFLEESNVDPVSEMVSMIENFRLYEANQNSNSIQDETVKQAVEQVGSV